ncbi:30S ribosome-binding factor RbfA [Acidiluteibacter ferrifornacis]|uniref:Ribosome-binding factor A n=1 Tax=Acidiluteibacter ferrifornacis TaxID=2692424 RepID=A0A6N9NHL4_9FLAO|nr:30S ribosome-binding factor RbfA [Acidiluteibacter ferrifornacis]MBR9830672.1 30S ribosome-binding factor RbfA [bacterium]NBG64687.1 30S ribosome-binding factor RbfA [Acidiluteibacter ferrifornacis]
MDSLRQSKVARLLQKEIGDIFIKEFKSPLPGVMISITQVRVSPDLGVAKVYVSLFPSKDKKEALETLRKKTSEVRGFLGNRVAKQLRIVPEIIFYLDDSFDYAEKIDQLLKK